MNQLTMVVAFFLLIPRLVLGQGPAPFDTTKVSTEAYNIREVIKVLEALCPSDSITPESVERAVDQTVKKLAEKSVAFDPGSEWKGLAPKEACQQVLGIAYESLADRFQAIAEKGGDGWSKYYGWTELTNVRILQKDYVGAKVSFWGAQPFWSESGLTNEQLLESAGKVATNIAQGLISKNKLEEANAHLIAMAKIWPNVAADMRAALEISQAFQEGDQAAISYAKKYPDLIQTAIREFASRNKVKELSDVSTQAADCRIKNDIVVYFQKSPGNAALDLAQDALKCDSTNPKAQNAFSLAVNRWAHQTWDAMNANKNLTQVDRKKIRDQVVANLKEAEKYPDTSSHENNKAFLLAAEPYLKEPPKQITETTEKNETANQCISPTIVSYDGSSTKGVDISKVVDGLKILVKHGCKDQIDYICTNQPRELGHSVITLDDDKKVPQGNQILDLIKLCNIQDPEKGRLSAAAKTMLAGSAAAGTN